MGFPMIHLRKIRLLIPLFLVVKAALAFDTITGTVHNETTGKPAAGDEVVLLRLAQGMEEESHARTDAQGAFVLNVTSPQDAHLLQVIHQGVKYDQLLKPIRDSAPIGVVVYDATARVDGLTGTMGIVQLASQGRVLKVTEMLEISNRSTPPITQYGQDSFTLTLPAGAVVDSAQARRAQGMWLNVAVGPVKGQPGKYAVDFPLRPGASHLNLVYHLSYPGSATLHLKVPYPTAGFGVMHPPSMTFKALTPNSFQSGDMGNGLIVEQPGNGAVADDVPAFEISGAGVAPQHGTEAAARPAPPAPAVVAPPSNVHTTQSTATSVPEQAGKEMWLMVGGIIVLLGVGAFTFWRMGMQRAPVAVSTNSGGKEPLLDGLKEELFQLESERLHGTISPEEYAATKQALSESIQRAMARKSSS
jgi:hypothetical protein